MRYLTACLALLLTLTACATTTTTQNPYDKYHVYCRTHAKELVGEVDEEGRYRGCILYMGRHDIEVTDNLPKELPDEAPK